MCKMKIQNKHENIMCIYIDSINLRHFFVQNKQHEIQTMSTAYKDLINFYGMSALPARNK